MNALRRAVRALGASAHAAGRRPGVSGAQLFVLRQIAAAPGLSPGDLARRTLAGQSTVSEVVGRLVAAGLVERRPSAADARRAELTLTARGRRAVAGAPPTAQERLAAGLATLAPADRDALATLLDAWLAAAGLADVPATLFFEPGRSDAASAAAVARPRNPPSA
ncbi:hypothetical protein tb265_10120 [Gemmatimonadetes bacterium T265]|nr:hypothetical protein tb265_10120 [Gemmatimonadetes bacterium T265]